MKKIYLLATLLVACMCVNAQYFQHIYGTPSNDQLSSGVNTVVQPQGHFMAAHTKSFCQPGVSTIPAAFTDIAGNIPGAPFFERDYTIIGPGGNMLHARDPQVFELASGAGFGIIGMYLDITNPNINGVFYLQLDPLGNPLATFDYPALPGGGFTFNVIEVGGITKSTIAAIGDVYVTGTVMDNTGQPNVFAMRINEATGAIVWSQIYNILPPVNGPAWGKDVAENIASPFGPPSIAVVGMVNSTWSGPAQDDGFIMHLDAATGNSVHPIIISGTPNTHDHFNSIKPALPGPFPPGFIIGGGTMVNGNMDFYIVRIDPIIAPMFFNSFDYSFAPGSDNDCYDVIQRLNTACQYEYYAVGQTNNGILGNTDVMVVKMDQFGNGVPFGEYTYGSPGFDFGRAVDILNVGAPCAPPPMPAPAGLSVFGTWDGPPGLGGNADMYMVKAYYNGLSGCNEAFNNPVQLPANPTMPHSPVVNVSNLGFGTLFQAYSPVFDITLCFNPLIAGGNNNRVANPDKGDVDAPRPSTDNSVILLPNPSENGTKSVTLKVNADVAGEAEVMIYDMLGKQYYTGKFNLTLGMNDLPIDISRVNMSQGVYSVVMRNGQKVTSSQMIIK